MQDKTLLILGGTSALALAYGRHVLADYTHICLVGRNEKQLEIHKNDLLGRGTSEVTTHLCDLANLDGIKENWQEISENCSNITDCLIAYGLLGNQDQSQKDPDALRQNLTTNFVSTALWAELMFEYFDKKGHGNLIIIGSVAGDRGRQSNYHYGSAKAGLEAFCQGLSHRAAHLVGSKIQVLLVKPGFIDTPMTDNLGLDKTGPLWATPQKIAKITHKALRQGRNVVYAPWFWRYILLLIVLTPRFIFHKTKL